MKAGRTMDIAQHLMSKPKLAQAARWNKADGTLSGGERALATIVDALLADASRLDATELTALAETLTTYAQEVQTAENAARDHLGKMGLNLNDQSE